MEEVAGERQATLRGLVEHFKKRTSEAFSAEHVLASDSAIQAIIVPGNAEVVAAGRALQGHKLSVLRGFSFSIAFHCD